jgi:lysophospholipase L1-like esterase
MNRHPSRRARLALVGLVITVAAAVAAVLVPGGASAHPGSPPLPSHPLSHDIGYLALGDSVAFGYRPPQVTPTSAYLNAHNFGSYAEDLAGIDGLALTNASCPGETTASLITAGAQSNGCENSLNSPTGYRTNFPLHVAYTGTQLAFAVSYLRQHPRTGLVTVDVGANDVFVCQQATADKCTGTDLAAVFAQISANLTTLYRALRSDAHYHGRLVLLSYYALSYTDPTQVAGTQALNAALADPTRRFGGIVADGYSAFARAAQAAGGDPCAAGLLIPLPDGTCNIHPSPYGHAVLAGAIQKVIAHRGF